ncbi:protein of unknown function DUF808 [Methylobacterium sp. 4-46]|uniref:DUF808 domain-containing protein n=1 Tax=unclassified Methylobacterium TaxID=2615210 RepID=UPI000152D603|nr:MULTISPECIES: DUF808 domain-containing protein [Methylobacterium]ACA20910.1 protein of unknown function DUF808 [Methylobacterium sp. 4-46]WFT80063.1 DUF808 domain-containing protein [Methylobacterium nodulans]
MATGLIALLDDIAGLAKLAAASLDDAASQATRAGAKAVGVVIDDTAVTPRYVTGFSASRELPIIGKIALGSLRNKLLFLLPGALALSFLAPFLLTPLLMLGGAYLCFEGAEKVVEALWPHGGGEEAEPATPRDAGAVEDQKVASAIKTDFILSAEIMALTLAGVAEAGLATQVFVLAAVGIGITGLVYGVVALIVKADDVGLALAREERPASTLFGLRAPSGPAPTPGDRRLRPLTRAVGRGLVRLMPALLRGLGIVGTAAMIWVGGGILVHGLEGFGLAALGHGIAHAAEAVGDRVPFGEAVAEWVVTAALSGVVGLVVGALLIPVARHLVTPALASLRA